MRKTTLNQVLVVSGVLSTLVSCGLGIGFLPQLQVSFTKTHQKSLDDKSQNDIESVGELAFMLSILIIPFAMEKMGRRVANIVTVLPSFFSWIMCFKPANFFGLVAVSVLRNISLGGAVTISNIIISEFCGPKYSATFILVETAAITLGVLLCHVCVVYSCSSIISVLGVVSAAYGLINYVFSDKLSLCYLKIKFYCT